MVQDQIQAEAEALAADLDRLSQMADGFTALQAALLQQLADIEGAAGRLVETGESRLLDLTEELKSQLALAQADTAAFQEGVDAVAADFADAAAPLDAAAEKLREAVVAANGAMAELGSHAGHAADALAAGLQALTTAIETVTGQLAAALEQADARLVEDTASIAAVEHAWASTVQDLVDRLKAEIDALHTAIADQVDGVQHEAMAGFQNQAQATLEQQVLQPLQTRLGEAQAMIQQQLTDAVNGAVSSLTSTFREIFGLIGESRDSASLEERLLREVLDQLKPVLREAEQQLGGVKGILGAVGFSI